MTGTHDKIRSLFLATLMVLSVFGGTVAFSGAAAAQVAGNANAIDYQEDTDPTEQKNNQYDETLTSSGGPFWQGQRLAFQVSDTVYNNLGSEKVVQIREANARDGSGQRVGSLVTEVSLDQNGEAIVDTEGLEGSYVITTGSSETTALQFDSDGLPDNTGDFSNGQVDTTSSPQIYQATSDASFEISAQNVNANWESDESAQEQAFLNLDSARSGYNLLVEADGGLDDEDLIEIFKLNGELDDEVDNGASEGPEVDSDIDNDNDGSVSGIVDADDAYSTDNDGVVFQAVTSDANITGNFSGIDTGDYEFEFTVTDTGISDTAPITVSEEDDVDAEILRGGVATAAQGDYAVIPIQLEETSEAEVNLGFNDVNFNATVKVNDGNDDGLVTLEMNTFLAGRTDQSAQQFLAGDDRIPNNGGDDKLESNDIVHNVDIDGDNTNEVTGASPNNAVNLANETLAAAMSTAENEDDVIVNPDSNDDYGMRALGAAGKDMDSSGTGSGIDGVMEPEQYDVNITSLSGNELDVGTAQVVEPQISGINSWTMPGEDFDDIEEDETGELYEYVENGELTQDNSIAEGDVLVYQIESTSMFGALKATEEGASSYAEAFNTITGYTDAASTNFKFYVEQTDESTNANLEGKELDLADSSNGVKVVPDEQNSSLFVVVDEGAAALARSTPDGDGDASLSMQEEESYVANWTVYEYSGIGDEDQYVTDEASIVEKSIDFDTDAGDVIRVAASQGQTISGSTSVAPGTELNVRLRSTGDSPFLEDANPMVSENGTFSATFDLSDRAQNATFDANAQGFDDDYDTPGVIGQAMTADVTFDDQTVEDGTVSVDASLSDGGFVSIRSGSASGEVLGASSFTDGGTVTVDIGDVSNETTLYAVAHMDTNDNEQLDFEAGGDTDTPYMLNGSAVSDSATVSPQEDTEPVDTTDDDPVDTTDDSDDEPADTTEAPPDTDAEQTTTDEGGPGFTAVLALVALVAAALLAVRRRD